MVFNFEVAVLIIGGIWLSALTFFLWQNSYHYQKLTRGVSNHNLKTVLEELLKELQIAQKDIVAIAKRCDTIEKEGSRHIQKIGLLRFNPFKDTGGNQSFILSLLDEKDSGVVISGLYSRSGTRWYAKRVEKGRGVEHELSEDEQKALKAAGII